jgi:curved DNA-binding protein CbpA
MNLVDALEILQIDKHEINSLTLEYLKKRYHKLALQNHPDKNGNTIASKETFQKINEAYEVLKREISIIDGSHEDDHVDGDNNSNNGQYYGYTYIVNLFIDGLLRGTYNEFISSIVKDIVSGYTTISLKLFEDLDKERALSVYNFIFKYKSILHINDSILVKVRDIILEKYNDVQIYILNPSINDLINDNVYKLIIEKEVYYEQTTYSILFMFNCFDFNIQWSAEGNKGTRSIFPYSTR